MKKSKINHNQSVSLWNYTLSPGWSRAEVEVLKLALQKFGIGKWSRIIRSECLPGKSIGQIYLQTQRIMGQQSLGDFMGLHIDIQRVFIDNGKRQNVTRKNNCIINTGDNPNKLERQRKIRENGIKYGLPPGAVQCIRLPKRSKSLFKEIILLDEIETNKFSTIEKIDHLKKLLRLVTYKLDTLGKFGRDYFQNFKLQGPRDPCALKVLAAKTEVVTNGGPEPVVKFDEERIQEQMMYEQYLKNGMLGMVNRRMVIGLKRVQGEEYLVTN